MNLTDEQRAAVDSPAKNVLLAAGPGSGKTATTVARIKARIAAGVTASEIIAITFTNAAARELESRLEETRLGYVGTLHGFALKMLKRHGTPLGYGDRIALVGEDGVADLVMAKAKRLGCKLSQKTLLSIKRDWTGIERPPVGAPLELLVIASYYADLREEGLVDFDTILTAFLELLNRGLMPAISALFVDEVQDSAVVDWDIYWKIPTIERWFVGDEDQSIYGFRGGRPDLMALRVPGEELMLQNNFRSRDEICRAAQSLIEHTSAKRFPKITRSTRGTGGNVILYGAATTSGAEVEQVVHAVSLEMGRGTLADEIAVLARTNAICADIRETMKATGIPVAEKTKSDLPQDWGQAKALIELCANPYNDRLAYFYLVERAKCMGGEEAKWRADAAEALRRAQSSMTPLSEIFLTGTSRDLAGVGQMLAERKFNAETRMRVATIIRSLPSKADLLELALAMSYDQGTADSAIPGVTITTIHQAKGCEWDAVIIAGCEEEVIIHRGADQQAVDEARRLMFVAVTRARERVYLTHSLYRKTSWGAMEQHKACRFIREMGL